MAFLSDFIPKVTTITDRPDLVQETTAALSTALRSAHQSSRFYFDIFSEKISNPGQAEFSLSLPNRFRAVANIRGPNFQVKEIPPAALFDEYVMLDKTNTYYLAGSQINFNVQSSYSALTFEYFRHPTFEDSYIAQNHEDYITYLAAATVFGMIKDFELQSRWKQMADAQFVELERYAYQF